MSSDAVRALLARAAADPAFRAIVETNGYVALTAYDLSAEELAAARRWDLEVLRRLAAPTGRGETAEPSGVGATRR